MALGAALRPNDLPALRLPGLRFADPSPDRYGAPKPTLRAPTFAVSVGSEPLSSRGCLLSVGAPVAALWLPPHAVPLLVLLRRLV